MSRRSRLIKLIRTRSGSTEIIRVQSVPVTRVVIPSKDDSHDVMADVQRRPIIFLSELDYISRCILDYPEIETGGQLFGYWTEDNVPVVVYAIGPGRNANHQVTFFNQDVNYLLEIGGELRSRYGLHHIGEWHSHHKLGLARPSGHDVNTMVSTIKEKNLGRFLLCIGNTDGLTTTFNPFLCDSDQCREGAWEVIKADSPVRNDADSNIRGLVHPRTATPSHKDRRLSRSGSAVRFPAGYWMNEQWGRDAFNDYVKLLKKQDTENVNVTPKIDEYGLAHVIREGLGYYGEKIRIDVMFPLTFPHDPPRITVSRDGIKVPERNNVRWRYDRNDLAWALWSYENEVLHQYR